MVEVGALAPNNRCRPKTAPAARHHAFANLIHNEMQVLKLAWHRVLHEVWVHREIEEFHPGYVKILRLHNGVLQFINAGKKCHKASSGSSAAAKTACRQATQSIEAEGAKGDGITARSFRGYGTTCMTGGLYDSIIGPVSRAS